MIKTLINYNPEREEYDEGLPYPEHLISEDDESEINHSYIYDNRSFKTIRRKELYRKAYKAKQIQFNFVLVRKGKKDKKFRIASSSVTRSRSIFC